MTCRVCGAEVVYAGRGRPRLYCDACHPRPTRPARVPARRAASQDDGQRVPRRRGAAAPGCPLTRRELDAVCALANGRTYKQIALETGRQETTIRTQLHSVYKRLPAAGAIQAIVHCWKRGWLLVDGVDVTVSPAPVPLPKVARADVVTPEQRLLSEAVVRAIRSGDREDDLEARVLLRIVRRKAAERALAAGPMDR